MSSLTVAKLGISSFDLTTVRSCQQDRSVYSGNTFRGIFKINRLFLISGIIGFVRVVVIPEKTIFKSIALGIECR
jgi:hypothetical protein